MEIEIDQMREIRFNKCGVSNPFFVTSMKISPLPTVARLSHSPPSLRAKVALAIGLALAGGALASAQTLDFSGLNLAAINSAAGQDIAFAGGTANVKVTAGPYGSIYLLENNEVLMLSSVPGASTIQLSFTGLTSGTFFFTDDELQRDTEISTFTTNGGNWVLESLGNGEYGGITGTGTSSVTFHGANPNSPFGNGLSFSSLDATLLSYTVLNGTSGLRVNFVATPVPEPAIAVLGFAGMAASAFRRRRVC
jgi:hypothetical protein